MYLACRYRERAERTAAGFSSRLRELPLAMPQMCAALHQLAAPPHARQVFNSVQSFCMAVPDVRQVGSSTECTMPTTSCALLQVIVAGPKGGPKTQELLAAAHSVFVPDKVVMPIDITDCETVSWYKQHNPEALEMAQQVSSTLVTWGQHCTDDVKSKYAWTDILNCRAASMSQMSSSARILPVRHQCRTLPR